MSKTIKKLIAVLTCISLLTSMFLVTVYAEGGADTAASGAVTVNAGEISVGGAAANETATEIAVKNLGSEDTVLSAKVTVETAGFYDLSSSLSIEEFTSSNRIFYYKYVNVTNSSNETKKYIGSTSYNFFEDTDVKSTKYDKKFIVPVYLSEGENTVEIVFRSNRSANWLKLYSLTLTPSNDYSIVFSKDSTIEGTNDDSTSNTSSDYLYLDGNNPPSALFEVTVDADGYYDLYADLQFTSFGGADYPYWFKTVSVTYPDNTSYSFISQNDKPTDTAKLIGQFNVENTTDRYTRKASTVLLKKGTNTVKFAVKSPRRANNIMLYTASLIYRGNKIFEEDENNIININTGITDLKIDEANKYESATMDTVSIRGGSSHVLFYCVKTESDRYTLSMDINPAALAGSAAQFGFTIQIDGGTIQWYDKAFTKADYTAGADATITLPASIVFDNSKTKEHKIRIGFVAQTADVITVKGIKLTKFVPAFAMNDDGTVGIDTTNRGNALEYDLEGTSGAVFRGYQVDPNLPDKKGHSATYRITGAKEGNYKITFNYVITQNDITPNASYDNVAGFIVTAGNSTSNCLEKATDSNKTVIEKFAAGTSHIGSAIIKLTEGVNDIVITTAPNSSSHIVQTLNSIGLEKAFVSNFSFDKTSFGANDTVAATFVVGNSDLAPDNAVGMIVVQYDANGNLIAASGLDMKNVWIKGSSETTKTVTVTADENAAEIKAFLWTTAFAPVARAISISKTIIE